jgi:HEPN domain-containing protein
MDAHSRSTEASARRWLERARLDLEDAKALHDLRPTAYDNVGFLCQQATEKLLKAFLVAHRQSFPKTHDIRTLLVGHVAAIDSQLAVEARFADELTPYAVAARYPAGFAPVSRETADELIATMDRVWDLFEPRIIRLLEADQPPPAERPTDDCCSEDATKSGE